MNAPELKPERLISWGFAPGSYACFCSECGKQHVADKRAWRCLDCAERRVENYRAALAAIQEGRG